MKGLIPAAGRGTRLEPITLAIPKELLMIGDKAVIEYVIEAMKTVGITDITIVVGWRKHAILDYLGSGERLGVNLSYVVQDKRDGLAKAVQTGEKILKDDTFVVILGDDFFYPASFLKEIIEFHKQNKADATIGVAEVKDVTRHGIIKTEGNKIIDLIEKPTIKEAPSNLGCMGVYVFKPSIFEAIKKTKPGYNNEYQLTDSIKILVNEGKKVLYKTISGEHIDVGTLDDYKKANARFSQINK
jgi:glucose-1-phosphate thymidylyltransferase long form